MYRISKSKNAITKLEERLFSELGFKEREHLQEWIAKNPDVLDEERLIIQKEVQGFNDTKERLDLLALDKDGGLVIIENKLDDTGRDVVWQALKYTSYCSTLTNIQIIKIYQDYLDKYEGGGNAKENILEFLDRENEDDLILNNEDQKIVLIANNYRKEVTATVLWLLEHDIQIKCFKATPYSFGDELFLKIEQIIPLPETAEFMIDAKEKQKEKKGKSAKLQKSQNELIEFWGLLKNRVKIKSDDFLANVTPRPTYYMGFFKGQGFFAYCIGRRAFRVELYFRSDLDKTYFDNIYNYKEEIESKLKGVVWERRDGKTASRIKIDMTIEEKSQRIGKWSDQSSWEYDIEWFVSKMNEFYKVVFPIWEKVQSEIKGY